VFLAPNNPTSRSQIGKKGRGFLDKFVRDNTIGYRDEKAHREWSYGYYLNNARFRLLHVIKIRRGKLKARHEWLKNPRGADLDVAEEWEKHMELFKKELAAFKKRLRASSR
jgi:hypothetical protein